VEGCGSARGAAIRLRADRGEGLLDCLSDWWRLAATLEKMSTALGVGKTAPGARGPGLRAVVVEAQERNLEAQPDTGPVSGQREIGRPLLDGGFEI
jgi:hypothetical protein